MKLFKLTPCQVAASEIKLRMKQESEALGFLPDASIYFHAVTGGVYIVTDNNGLMLSYAIFARGKASEWTQAHIYQVWVHPMYRRQGIGTMMIDAVERVCKNAGAKQIACYVAQNLPATRFWESIGYIQIGAREGGKKRGRHHNHYRKELS